MLHTTYIYRLACGLYAGPGLGKEQQCGGINRWIVCQPAHPLFIYIVTGYHTAICTDINNNQPSNICADAVPLTHNHKNEQHQHWKYNCSVSK